MTGRRFVFRLASLAGLWTAVILAAHAAGLRINETPSLPMGLWLIEARPQVIERGQIVSFCPPDLTLFRMGRDRGYLSRGRCPGDFEPMLKPVVAVEGDEVEVTDDGVVVNGRLIANTAPHGRDSAGRPMPFPPIGLRVVGPGEVWFASSYAASSFDSRYFGAVLAAQIEGLARPLWVWETAP
jgi:conjugative transfer signal peptidase TraF